MNSLQLLLDSVGRHQVDITGLIGQYAHGNEPSHHMAYLYNYINKPWKSQERVSQILTEMYSNAPMDYLVMKIVVKCPLGTY